MTTTIDLLIQADSMLAESWSMTEEEFQAALDAFLGEAADKLARLRAVHVALTARVSVCKSEAERLTAARRSAEKQDERVTELAKRLLLRMRELGETPNVPGVARLQRNGGKPPLLGLDRIDPAALPDELVIVRHTADPVKVRAFLEAGGTIDGVTIGEAAESVRFA